MMRQLVKAYRSQIQYAVIGPYLALMILVMLVGSFIALTLVADSWQERFDNQLGQVARNFTESFAQREIGNIGYLGQITFTAPNADTGAPSVPQAIANQDLPGLESALQGLWQLGQSNNNVRPDRLIVFDLSGVALADWEHTRSNPAEPTRYVGTNLAGLPLVDEVLRGVTEPIPGNNEAGDKYSGLISFRSADGQDNLHFFTVSPVYLNDTAADTQRLVGGLLVAQRLDILLNDLQERSQAALSTIYDVSGVTRATTISGAELLELDMSPGLIERVAALNTPAVATSAAAGSQRTGEADDPCLDIGNLTGRLVTPVESSRLPSCSVKDVVTVSEREFQLVYAPLLIRGIQSGYFAVGLSTDFVVSAWSASRSAVLGITAGLALVAVFVGYSVARRITRPLNNLVEAAEAVTSGHLERRSSVQEQNELGRLSSAFNQMTEHLLRLYTASRELNRTIEVEHVLTVATEAASAFVPGTEALALLERDDGFAYRLRSGAALALPPNKQRLGSDTPLLAALAASDPYQMQLTAVDDEAALVAAGLAAAGMRTVYAAPVFRQRQFAGALLFAHPEPVAFNEAEEQSLAVIANMAVAVLTNAVLYGQVQRDAKERQAILTSIGDGVVVCDDAGRIVLLNRAAEQILDLPNWRVSRPRLADLPLEVVPQTKEMFGHIGEQFRMADRTITLTRSPLVAEDGNTAGEVLVLHDVTEAVAVDQAKTEFIATISHELRTPLTVIRGFTELLLRGTGDEKLSADQSDLLNQVRARAVDMTDMVNNAILIADIESGQLKTELHPQDVEMILNSALAPLRPAYETKRLSVTLDIAPELPAVMADREQLKRAFVQLLDNARRYSDQGGVTVRAWSEQGVVHVEFEDTGQGIAPDVLPRLFTRFQRVEGNNSQQRGSGLGLAITKQLIERQGGVVQVSSTLGQGSIFTIILQQVNEHSLAVVQSNESTSAS